MGVTVADTATRIGKGAGNVDWKLNQELLATVINSNSRGKLLRIEGNTYAPLNALQVDPGKTLQLKVTALSPFIELALLNTAKISERAGMTPAVILSEKLLRASADTTHRNASAFLTILQTLDALSPQSLSPATAALIAALRQRIVLPDSLAKLRTLKPALRDASLLLDGNLHPDDAGEVETNLKSLLLQVLRSISGGNAPAGKAQLHGDLDALLGMSLYQSVSNTGNGPNAQLARRMEDELLRMFIFQKTALDESEEHGQRWLFELPVNFQDRVRSVAIRIMQNRKQRPSPGEATWAAHFTFELPLLGCLEIRILIADPEVAVFAACEHTATANLLTHHQGALREKLATFGLCMTELGCEVRDKATFVATQAIVNARESESVPLEAFGMRRNSQPVVSGIRIPDALYCAMASLFGFILDIEESAPEIDTEIVAE